MSGVLQFVAESPDAVDLQFHRVINGSTAAPTFQYNTNSYRQVAFGANALVGGGVCHYGWGSGTQRCSTVLARNVPGGNWVGMTVTEGNVSSGGDSGGPWFTNDVARGTHSGVGQYQGTARSFYVPWTRFSESTNATLVTGEG